MGRVAGVLDDPPGFPLSHRLEVDVLEGGKLTSNNVAGSFARHLQSFAIASGAVPNQAVIAASQDALHNAGVEWSEDTGGSFKTSSAVSGTRGAGAPSSALQAVWEDCSATVGAKTHTENQPEATDMNYSSSPPSLQKGEGQLTPSLTSCKGTNVSEKARDASKSTFQSIFQPPPFNPKQYSFPSDRQRKTEYLTFIPIMTITTIYTNKYMEINVYSFPHRRDVMISNVNYLGQCGWFLIML